MTPQEPKGEEASADAGIAVARRILEHALLAYGSSSERGRACTEILTKIARHWGRTEEQAESIMPAELKSALMSPGGEPGQAPTAAPPGGGAPGGGAQPGAMGA